MWWGCNSSLLLAYSMTRQSPLSQGRLGLHSARSSIRNCSPDWHFRRRSWFAPLDSMLMMMKCSIALQR